MGSVSAVVGECTGSTSRLAFFGLPRPLAGVLAGGAWFRKFLIASDKPPVCLTVSLCFGFAAGVVFGPETLKIQNHRVYCRVYTKIIYKKYFHLYSQETVYKSISITIISHNIEGSLKKISTCS